MIIGIDPGTTESGYAIINDKYEILDANKIDNDLLIERLQQYPSTYTIVVESIQSYGMVMGKSTIETCYFIGRIIQVCSDTQKTIKLIPRPEYGKAIVGGAKVSDVLIRTALENRFGSYEKGKIEKRLKDGTVKQAYVAPGPLVLLAGETDKRSAFAVACYYLDCKKNEVNNAGNN